MLNDIKDATLDAWDGLMWRKDLATVHALFWIMQGIAGLHPHLGYLLADELAEADEGIKGMEAQYQEWKES